MTTVTDFMILSAALAFLISTCLSSPQPGHIHEKYIIHAPIKFKTIHHYKVEKIPIHIKKHIHHHKYHEDHHEVPVIHDHHDHHDHHEILESHPDFSDHDHDRFDYADDNKGGHYDAYDGSDEDYQYR